MRTVAIVCNILVLGATGATVVTEGMPAQARDLLLTSAVLAVALLSAVVLVSSRVGGRMRGTGLLACARGATFVANVLLCAACLWVAVTRYPYQEGNSIIPFAMLLVGTPLVTVAAISGRKGTAGGHTEAGTA